MGCGASKDPKIGVVDSYKPPTQSTSSNYNNNKNNSNSSKDSQNNKNGFKKVELKNSDNSANDSANIPIPDSRKPLAFVIQFDEQRTTGEIQRPPPGRLRLDPIRPVKKEETMKQLSDKMKQAEYNRQQMLRNRVKSSKKRSSNRRSENFDYDPEDPYYANPQDFKGKDFKEDEYDEEEQRRKQRLLKSRRIMRADYDEEVEHDKNYRQSEDDY